MLEDFMSEHEAVFVDASQVFRSRSQTRGQMWLETSIKREMDMITEKLNRAESALSRGLDDPDMMREYEDSLVDLINFANFAIKKARRGVRK